MINRTCSLLLHFFSLVCCGALFPFDEKENATQSFIYSPTYENKEFTFGGDDNNDATTGMYLADGEAWLEYIEDGNLLALKAELKPHLVNIPTEDEWTLLTKAIEEQKKDIVEFLLTEGARTDILGPEGFPLTAAAATGDCEIVQLLLKHKADPNAFDPAIDGPVFVGLRDAAMIELLVQHGADLTKRNTQDQTALIVAALKGNLSVCKLLIGLRVDVNNVDYKEFTPLLYAVFKGHYEVAQLLIASGAFLEKGPGGLTPLIIAAQLGNAEMVRLLLESGASVRAKTDTGYTALMAAAESSAHAVPKKVAQENDQEMDRVMQDIARHAQLGSGEGVSMDVAEIDEFLEKVATGTHPRLEKNEYPEVVKLLLEYGADVTKVNNEGHTVLDFEMSYEVSQLIEDHVRDHLNAG